MNRIRNPKIFLLIICLALLLNNGCISIPKDRPATSLNSNFAKYKVKPKVSLQTSFQYRLPFENNATNKDNTLKEIIEKVIKEDRLFASYSFEADDSNTYDYKIQFILENRENLEEEKSFVNTISALLWFASFSLMPVVGNMQYSLTTYAYDKSGKELYSYSCENDTTVSQYSFILPTEMIKKMVKEALFNVIDNSGIIESYKLEP